MEVVPFDAAAAEHFGAIAAALSRRGVPIGAFDTLIAAHALAMDAAIVTRNRHFDRVPGLQVVDWHG